MVNDPYTALRLILQSNSNITDILSTYKDTTIPLISGGVLAETETNLPAIVYYNNSHDENYNLSDTIFTVNCYADTERNSFILAKTVVKEFKGRQTTAGGYPVTLSAKILTSIPDPVANEVNTAVEVRLYNIGGAL